MLFNTIISNFIQKGVTMETKYNSIAFWFHKKNLLKSEFLTEQTSFELSNNSYLGPKFDFKSRLNHKFFSSMYGL
jgi:hypothetical protein